ncbi:MAG: hypothetical protein A2087_09910 [Spirochaetes bacterium GWD1_61_31]|nr:MAG: hypothetical protein A2Y37_07205 [Spirochaetes bacterium GWB1_60_80]OHD34007.1 MAG: hypothetical protein A2004_02135 [Spirochaetes bacterium GWC1_61_12]OHD41550.1 MAG: hypothetical protein A2087_09910 [Spirochaetes bacterium GWD1_61_31]OHD59184.1 MAG: hypothetical protein A2Y32_00165 [Spirochaetes bacterium GWF1_60_12]HAW86380.1 hypothetical protein [Spirochaetaceae bacterium]
MKYIRILLALLFGAAVSGIGLLAFKLFGIAIFDATTILTVPFIFLVGGAATPCLNIAVLSWKSPLIQIEGAKENALLLTCTYTKTLPLSVTDSNKRIQEIANSILFNNNKDLYLTIEADDYLCFYVDDKAPGGLEKEKKVNQNFNNSKIETHINRLLKKPVAFSTTLTIPRIACAMLRNCTGF